MTAYKVLVPYNFAPYDSKALAFVAQVFSGRREVEITLFNAYTPLPDVDTRDSPAAERIRQSLNYLSQRIREQEEDLERVRRELIEDGFEEGQVHSRFEPRKKDVPGQILEAVSGGGFKTVVLSREPRKMRRFFTASVYQKVVEGIKDATVCVVS